MFGMLYQNRPLDELDATPHVRKVMREFVYFEPQPMIGKVIAIGSPNEQPGSPDGDSKRLGDRVKRLPRSLKTGYQRIVRNDDRLLVNLTTGIPDSADQLSEDSPIFKATDQLRLAPSVRFHSITSNIDRLTTAADNRRFDGWLACEVNQSVVCRGKQRGIAASRSNHSPYQTPAC